MGFWIGIRDWDWAARLGIGIGDLELGYWKRIGDWGLELGIGHWDRGLGTGDWDSSRDWRLGLRFSNGVEN